MVAKYRLNLKAIEKSLRDVQREFPKINEILNSRRDSMTDEVVENMMAGYLLVDQALTDGVDLLTPMHVGYLIELSFCKLRGERAKCEHLR